MRPNLYRRASTKNNKHGLQGRPRQSSTARTAHRRYSRDERIAFSCLIFVVIWIYIQYRLLPSPSSAQSNLTKVSHYNQDSFITSSDFELISKRLHANCRYAYSHSSSHIQDIHLQIHGSLQYLQFLTLSDYGIIKQNNSNNPNVQSLLQLINTMNSHLVNSHFVVSAGDHFYDNEVNTAHHPRWNAVFDQFMKNKVFLPAVGNKDWLNTSKQVDMNSINAQIERTFWSNNHWCLPRLFYTVRFVLNHNLSDTLSFSVRFIMLDTTSYIKQYKHFDYLSKQYQFLSDTLVTNQNDDWIIVVGHHPFESFPKTRCKRTEQDNYSFDDLQNATCSVWKQKMMPILKLLLKYENVQMYISGHHHIWRICSLFDEHQRLKLLTMITGSAGRRDHHFDAYFPLHMIAGGEEESFGKVMISKNIIKIQVINKQNQSIFDHFYYRH